MSGKKKYCAWCNCSLEGVQAPIKSAEDKKDFCNENHRAQFISSMCDKKALASINSHLSISK